MLLMRHSQLGERGREGGKPIGQEAAREKQLCGVRVCARGTYSVSGSLSSWHPQRLGMDPSTVSSWLYDFIKFSKVRSINRDWLGPLSLSTLTPLCHISPHVGVSVENMGVWGN